MVKEAYPHIWEQMSLSKKLLDDVFASEAILS
jgi:hypothetical protein